MILNIPDFSLVVLIGASGAGKSTFARTHFKPTEVISSDVCRGLVSDDETDQDATADAFSLLHTMLELRLKRRKLCVVDATNVRSEDRRSLLALAKRWHALSIAVILDPGEDVCRARNSVRPDRAFGGHVIRSQMANLNRGRRDLKKEGFKQIYSLSTETQIQEAEVVRTRLWTDRQYLTGPFDIIGDVHGCATELETLLETLGYTLASFTDEEGEKRYRVTPPEGRKTLFLGDIVDRGPRIADTLRLVMDMVEQESALCVLGNHEAKLCKWMEGRAVKITHGLECSIAELENETPLFRERVRKFINGLVSHYLLDGGALAIAHAGIKESMLGRASGAIRGFCLFGETTGETDEFGLPVRYNWAGEYRGKTKIVYGHTPVMVPEWQNNTLCVDTGCVFGGTLTALRYPEMETVSTPALQLYREPARPLTPPRSAALPDILDLADVSGKRLLHTPLVSSIPIRAENMAGALEVMSRFAIDPRWLIYLPPTMSPAETSTRDATLEHPDEALAYFKKEGIAKVVCEQKHMGSRAMMVVCRTPQVALARFGIDTGDVGAIYTRSGRSFFGHSAQERATHVEVLNRTIAALDKSCLFDELQTDWVLLDTEIMPWSAKAGSLIMEQFAPTGAAARIGLSATIDALRQAVGNGNADPELVDLLANSEARLDRAAAFNTAVRAYDWPVDGIEGLSIAPFHLLASEGAVHAERDHLWHMNTLARLAAVDPLFLATPFHVVDLADPQARQAVTDWWEMLTAEGGEGMVIKPFSFIARRDDEAKGPLIQPAIKCRGRNYLRIIYGPDYDSPEQLPRLRKRNLSTKRSLALREFALGLEALNRFVARDSLRRVHECVFAVLALETEPVDSRL